jgi:hypothetical protein
VSKNTGFISHRRLTLPTDGTEQQVNVTGSMFICKEASYPFEMSFNDGQFFQFDQGLTFDIAPDLFTRLAFRCLQDQGVPTAPAPTALEFYCGNAQIVDSRLNIVRDPDHYQIFAFELARTLLTIAKTIHKPFAAASIGAGLFAVFYGTGGVGPGLAGAPYDYRRAIVITNNDPLNDLEVYTLGEVDDAPAPGDRIATVFPRMAWHLETSADLVVKNETAVPIACRVCEVFYVAAP